MACAGRQMNIHSINANDKLYFIQSIFNTDSSCKLTISDGSASWEGKVDRKSLEAWAKETDIGLKEYCFLMTAALSGLNTSNEEFQYDIEENNGELVLKWKRVEGNVKYCLGTVSLKQSADGADLVKDILFNCSANFKTLNASLASSRKANLELQNQYEDAVKELDKCCKLKESLEIELLAKFVLVLNEKKKKIRFLKQCLGDKPMRDNINREIITEEKQPSTSTDPTSEGASEPTKISKFNLEFDDDSPENFPTLPKRRRPLSNKPLMVSVSPEKVAYEPLPTTQFPSDLNTTTSSDSTIDVNDLLENT